MEALMPVILTMWEAEIRKIEDETAKANSLRYHVLKISNTKTWLMEWLKW
jgi:hypothetical protein